MNYGFESNYETIYSERGKRKLSRIWNPNEMQNPGIRRVGNIISSTAMTLLTGVIGGGALKMLSGQCQTYFWELFNLCGEGYGTAAAVATVVLSIPTAIMWYRTLNDW